MCSAFHRVTLFRRASTSVVLAICILFGGCGRQSETINTELNNASSSLETATNALDSVSSLIEACQHDQSKRLAIRGTVSSKDLQKIQQLTQLESLELYESALESKDIAKLDTLTNLKSLRLEDVAIEDSAVDALIRLTNIEVLNLPAAKLSDIGLEKLVSNLPHLTLLRLGSPHVTDVGLQCLADASKIRFLHLINVPLTDAGLKVFHPMHDLESLYIDGGNESDDGIRDLLRANPRLHFHRNQTHVAEDPNADGH